MRSLLLIIFSVFLVSCAQAIELRPSEDGSIELPSGVFNERDSIISLKGPWDFHWDVLLNPSIFASSNAPRPDLVIEKMRPWRGLSAGGTILESTGRATYHLKLRCDDCPKNMGVYIPQQISTSRIFVNGELVTQAGEIGRTISEDIPAREDSQGFFVLVGDEIDLVLHISNAEVFNGGMRGQFALGTESGIRRFALQRILFEVLIWGIILGSAIYHLFFYFMHRKEYSFLFFSLICFLLAVRLPFQGTKVYSTILHSLSWEFQSRFLMTLNFVAVPLVVAFLRGLFPNLVSRRTLVLYSIVAFLSLSLHFADLGVQTAGNLVYIALVFPFLGFHMLWVIYSAIREGRGSILMAISVGSLLVLSCLAYFQNYRGNEGGLYALAAFLFFVIFQALSLSRFFLSAVKARAELGERLRESHQALARQREELQVNLHDSLGGALTDLQIHSERQVAASSPESKSMIAGIHERVSSTVKMFRSQLLFMEDLAMAAEDVLPGIQMTLLRRYADAGREIDFDFTTEISMLLTSEKSKSFPIKSRLDLFFLMIELCTNDLKYGKGESFWRISMNGKFMQLIQRNGLKEPAETPMTDPVRAADRIRRLGGSLVLTGDHDEYAVLIRIPLS